MVYAVDLKSIGPRPCGFDSRLQHQDKEESVETGVESMSQYWSETYVCWIHDNSYSPPDSRRGKKGWTHSRRKNNSLGRTRSRNEKKGR